MGKTTMLSPRHLLNAGEGGLCADVFHVLVGLAGRALPALLGSFQSAAPSRRHQQAGWPPLLVILLLHNVLRLFPPTIMQASRCTARCSSRATSSSPSRAPTTPALDAASKLGRPSTLHWVGDGWAAVCGIAHAD